MIDFKQKIEEEDAKARRENRFSSSPEDIELILNSKKRKRFVTYTIAIVAIALIFSGRVLISSQNATAWFSEIGIINKIRHLVPSSDNKLKGEENDRVNILLLGMGGEGHDGAYLTDTIMLASFQPSTKRVSMISIPRDLVAPVSGWRKINSVNAYAEQKNPGSGGPATTQAISELLQIPIDYYIRADFNGFVNIIDELGGIDVNVENVLDDYTYPAYGQEDNPNYYARFEHLHFDKGWQTMNGARALKYARSRHASSLEGSDFARAKRQQLVLEAIKEKLLSSRTLLNPVMITKLVNQFNKNISTNLNTWEVLRLWELFKDVNRSQIINKVLSDAPDGLLVSGKGEDGAYILTPRSGNFSDVRNMVRDIFLVEGETQPKEETVTIKDNSSVMILNGTWISGLASNTASSLGQSKFTILKTGNAPTRDHEQSVIYDLSAGAKPDSLTALKKITGAAQSYDSPDWIRDYQASGTLPDFILILGTDANK